MEERELAYLYSLARVVLQPSIEESFSLPLYEAAACGTPGVAFQSGSESEDIVDGEMGTLVPIRDIPALAGAVADLVVDRDRAQRLGERATSRVHRSYTWDGHVESLSALLESVVAGTTTRVEREEPSLQELR